MRWFFSHLLLSILLPNNINEAFGITDECREIGSNCIASPDCCSTRCSHSVCVAYGNEQGARISVSDNLPENDRPIHAFTNTQSKRSYPNEKPQAHYNFRLLPPQQKCGLTVKRRLRRIVGGRSVTVGFPWVANIYQQNVSASTHSYKCGGSIITDRYILTAAHCVARLAAGTELKSVLIGSRYFADDKNLTVDCSEYKGNTTIKATPCWARVDTAALHKRYVHTTAEHDIALIRLSDRLDFEAIKVSPICLPDTQDFGEPTVLQVAGWGKVDSYLDTRYMFPTFLNVIDIQLVERDYCDSFHGPKVGRLLQERICLLGHDGVSSCFGDSGSPVSVVMETTTGQRTTQLGLVSYGDEDCGLQGSPVVAMNVAAYMTWILDHIKP